MDYIERAGSVLLKWGIVAGVVVWSLCAILALTLSHPAVVIFALITFAGIFAAIVMTVIAIIEIVHALETYRLKKTDPSHYRVRSLSSDDAKWLNRLKAFGEWLERKNEKPESNQ